MKKSFWLSLGLLHVPGKDRQGLSNVCGWGRGKQGAGTRGSGETGLNMEQARAVAGSGGRAGSTHDSVAQSALHKPLHTCYLVHRLLTFQME